MSISLPRRLQRFVSHEHGQALVLFAGGLAAFLGLVGLAVDVGLLLYTRTDLQKVADAAALAGAQDLPGSRANATSSANGFVTNNGGASTSASIAFSVSNDTITVTATRHVDYTFLRAIGLTGTDVSATAKVQVKAATGFTFDEADVFPYAVWGGQRTTPDNGCPYQICSGSTQVYRANNFQSSSHATGAGWAVNGNNFKGYFHHGTGVTQIDPNTWQTFSSGGNAIGQEPTETLDSHIASGKPILLPVIAEANCTGGCGTIKFKIVAWVALKITSRGNPSQDWTGTVVANYETPTADTGGSFTPPAAYPTVYTLRLVQ